MKKILFVAVAVIMVFSLLSCSNSSKGNQNGGVGGETVIGGDSSPEASVIPSGPPSPVTGVRGVGDYRPVQVQIDNEPTGRPQYGIQDADIVYEAMIEGADTRLSAIYNDKLPTKVGPVRSARVYFQFIQNEWDSIFIHEGGPFVQAWPESYIYSDENGGDIKVRVDGTRRPDDNILWSVNLKVAYANVQAAIDKYNYQRTQRNPLFKFDENVDYSKYAGITKVNIPFISPQGNQVEYRYDQAGDKLIRYCFGQPFLDATTNKAVEVKNVIVQYVAISPLASGEGGRIVIDIIGSGKAEFFVGGKHLTGTWEKADEKSGTVYKLSDGSDLILKPGNTWIELQPDTKTISVG